MKADLENIYHFLWSPLTAFLGFWTGTQRKERASQTTCWEKGEKTLSEAELQFLGSFVYPSVYPGMFAEKGCCQHRGVSMLDAPYRK